MRSRRRRVAAAVGLAGSAIAVILFVVLAPALGNGDGKLGSASTCEAEIRALEDDPNRKGAGLAARLAADRYSQGGEYDCAIQALKASLSLLGPDSPESVASHQRLAEVYEQAGLQLEAERQWLSLVDRFPGDSDYERDARSEMLVGVAEYYQRRDNQKAAEQAYLRAIETLGPNGSGLLTERAYRSLATLYESQGRFSSAADAAARLVAAIEVRVNEVPEEVDILAAALDERARLLDRAGRAQEAEQVRARSRELKSRL